MIKGSKVIQSYTREMFEKDYAKSSGFNVERLKQLGLKAIPCDCGLDCCRGWKMDSPETRERLENAQSS